jgi:hypothetical protein
MENEYTEEPDENQDEQVEIYSKWPIRLFSLFFSPIFGGVLLIINLRKAGYKQAIASVLLFSIGYTFITAMLLSSLGITGGLIPIIFNLMGGMILSDYFYKKYFPDEDYYPKPIWGALAVALVIYVAVFMAMYYSGNLPPEIMKMLPKK